MDTVHDDNKVFVESIGLKTHCDFYTLSSLSSNIAHFSHSLISKMSFFFTNIDFTLKEKSLKPHPMIKKFYFSFFYFNIWPSLHDIR